MRTLLNTGYRGKIPRPRPVVKGQGVDNATAPDYYTAYPFLESFSMVTDFPFPSPDEAVLWDNCNAAIVGTGTRCGMPVVVVYDYEKLVQCFLNDECDENCAREWVDFNIVGAYVGESTPIILYSQ